MTPAGRARRLPGIWGPLLAFAAYVLGFSALAVSQVRLPAALDEVAGRAPRIAVTFDDLPWNGPGYSEAEIRSLTDTLLGTLSGRNVPATGLVTCRGIRDGAPVLRMWLSAGFELGNHSYAHRDLNTTPVEEWLDDAKRCHEILRDVTGGSTRWFRYPMLHQGNDRAVRDSVARTLSSWGYSNAHVTIDNSEWLLARAYDIAMQEGDGAEAAAVVVAYVEHLVDAARHFRHVARVKFGRDVDHVLLLHANAIAARHIGDVLDALNAEGFETAGLDDVLADPIYARTDEYVGPTGLSWVYRAAPFGPEDPWDDIAEEALDARFRWR